MDTNRRNIQQARHAGLVEFLHRRVVVLVILSVICAVLSWVSVEYYEFRQVNSHRKQRMVAAEKADSRSQAAGGMYRSDVGAAIAADRAELTRSVAWHTCIATATGLFVCLLITLVWRSAAHCVQADIARLTEFFREAVHVGCRINPDACRFAEFATLADNANHMIDARDESQRRLAATLNSIGDGVISTDADAVVIGMNAMAEMLTEWSAREAVGRPIEQVMSLIDAGSGAVVDNPARTALEKHSAVGWKHETLLARRDGSALHIAHRAAPILDTAGTITGSVLVLRDVTQQRHSEALLRGSQERLETVLHAAQDAVIMLDHAGHISMWNDAAVRIFGYSLDEVRGKNLHTLLTPPRYREAHGRAFGEFQRTGAGTSSSGEDPRGSSVGPRSCGGSGIGLAREPEKRRTWIAHVVERVSSRLPKRPPREPSCSRNPSRVTGRISCRE